MEKKKSGLVVQHTLRARGILQSFPQVPLLYLHPLHAAMRSESTTLLVSFLAFLPVSLIFLALNLRIHMNQFVHSLHPRFLGLFFVRV